MRRLKPDEVPETLLLRLIEMAQMAPSGSNLQNSRWIIVRDPGRKARIAELNKSAVDGYLVRRRETVAAMEEPAASSQRRILNAVQWQADHLHEAPAIIIACLALRAAPAESFVSGLGAGGSVWPGVQNLLLAALGMGLGAAPTTLAMMDRAAFKAAVNLPADIEPVCVIPIGYPSGKFGPLSRRPVEEVLRWDSWS